MKQQKTATKTMNSSAEMPTNLYRIREKNKNNLGKFSTEALYIIACQMILKKAE